MKYKLLKIVQFIWREVIIKYLFCYIVALLSLIIAVKCDVGELWSGWLVSLSASMFSVPMVFVVYNIYSDALDRKVRKKITEKLKNAVNSLWVRYLYFSQYFYYAIEHDFPVDKDSLNQYMDYGEDEIFELISSNVFSGIFLFSKFDSFDEEVYDLVNDPIVAKYINREEVAVLFEFIQSYKELKDIFCVISKDDFIKCGNYTDIDILESEYAKNYNGEVFYDARWKRDDNGYRPFYSARYSLFEADKLSLKIKLSGNKSKELSKSIFKTYKCVKIWLRIHGETKIHYDNAIAINGRLYVDYDMVINEFMDNNICFNGKF